ncbi:hypothetical protein ARMA_0074 [Ardenticatena maritima]|uniref:Uncharacterized protein n=1 Tax=Ardenticatena maritima TaxID=872965 RepID=A0A0M8K690_9CHLR|nr:hypothetical protein ARMA_0074 [Ardenticatena maritima]
MEKQWVLSIYNTYAVWDATKQKSTTGVVLGVEKQKKKVGDDLLSHAAARAVPSALVGLTAGFGMGPGVPPPRKSPTFIWSASICAFDVLSNRLVRLSECC